MRIALIEKARRRGKFKVCFDDGKEVFLSREVIVDFGLRRNDEIADEQLLKIQDAQTYHDAYVAAIRLLNYKMRTERELSQRLGEKDFAPAIIERVVGRLTGLGLIDDSRFAEAFVASKTASKPIGKRELERRLRQKGVSKETALNALSAIGRDEMQIELAVAAAEAKIRSLRRFDQKKKQEKLIAFLARRGFEWDTIKKAVRTVLKGDPDVADF